MYCCEREEEEEVETSLILGNMLKLRDLLMEGIGFLEI